MYAIKTCVIGGIFLILLACVACGFDSSAHSAVVETVQTNVDDIFVCEVPDMETELCETLQNLPLRYMDGDNLDIDAVQLEALSRAFPGLLTHGYEIAGVRDIIVDPPSQPARSVRRLDAQEVDYICCGGAYLYEVACLGWEAHAMVRRVVFFAHDPLPREVVLVCSLHVHARALVCSGCMQALEESYHFEDGCGDSYATSLPLVRPAQ